MVAQLNYLIVTTDDYGRAIVPFAEETKELVVMLIQKMNLNLTCEDWIKPLLGDINDTAVDSKSNVSFDLTDPEKYDHIIQLHLCDSEFVSHIKLNINPCQNWEMSCNKYQLENDAIVEVIEWKRDRDELDPFEIECEE